MKVLFVAAEGVPFCKTGGLADVIGSLPRELKSQGVEVAVMMPKYKGIAGKFQQEMELIDTCTVKLGWRRQYCGVQSLKHNGVPFYFLDNEYYFKRPGYYGYFDDAERFAFFNRAVLEALAVIDFKPDVIHCHDWHTGMVPVFLTQYRDKPGYEQIRTVFTIHNLKYQGVFPNSIMQDLLNLGWEHFHTDGIEFHNNVSFMKGGLNYSDRLTTVSPTYAEEIQIPYYGCNLDGVLRKRGGQIQGILNGIDYDEWNPLTDPYIDTHYRTGACRKKRQNKLKLQEELNLPVSEEIPMLGMITRLVDQKGLDLVAHVIEEILALDIQLVVLGTGEMHYENMFRDLAYRYPEKVSANILFDNGLAHKIYAASDLFLMPSQFEPCGLGQLIALRYGSLPIVRETGGLKDTVVPFDEETSEGTGFTFANYNAHEMLFKIEEAVELYKDKRLWMNLVRNAMKQDFSWKSSANQYIELYADLAKKC